MRWIDAPKDLAFVEPQRDPVIALPRPWLPRRSLPRKHDRQPIEISHERTIERLVEHEQPGLVSEQLTHGNPSLAMLRELRPVSGDALVVVEQTARVRHGERHRRQPL